MCLLIVLHKFHPEAPLIVAANRDEQLSRPALAMTVLQADSPRILGGRDEMAGGTWLATNEHGVVAGLTNQHAPGGRNPAKRSRGELPLALTRQRTAEESVKAFARQYKPADYNPSWLLVADSRALYYVDMSAGESPKVTSLKPGIHILENQPIDVPSAKVDWARSQVEGISALSGEALHDGLRNILRSHREPADRAFMRGSAATEGRSEAAACVHGGGFGTRSSAMIFVGQGSSFPAIYASDGPPCINPIIDVGRYWKEDA